MFPKFMYDAVIGVARTVHVEGGLLAALPDTERGGVDG